jgi:hypothetical protein
MMETSTSVNKLNYGQKKQEAISADDVEPQDLSFYENIKPQLDSLAKNPSETTISKILAYSRAK